ncbi:MAG TPA: hypothetical protein VLC08_00070 [Chitinolyticbacter sp.]|nr:hypothetical protein [Chitinolyticbacter sp.]
MRCLAYEKCQLGATVSCHADFIHRGNLTVNPDTSAADTAVSSNAKRYAFAVPGCCRAKLVFPHSTPASSNDPRQAEAKLAKVAFPAVSGYFLRRRMGPNSVRRCDKTIRQIVLMSLNWLGESIYTSCFQQAFRLLPVGWTEPTQQTIAARAESRVRRSHWMDHVESHTLWRDER